MIICSHSNIDIIQGVIEYGDTEGITDWRISNSNAGILNILNSTSQNVNIAILENGNVGIGTTPIISSSKLEVAGDANITGVYKKNNRDVINDTSNYLLSTSNILAPRILTEVGNGSNYVSRLTTVLNTSADNSSNYILSTSNNLVNRIVSSITGGGGGSSQWTNVSPGIYYNNTLEITSSPAITKEISGNYTYQVFTYTTETAGAGTGQTLYTITVPTGGIICDILMVGGGGGGDTDFAAGGGGGAVLYATNINIPANTYNIKVGNGGGVNVNGKSTEAFGATCLGGGSTPYVAWSTANNGTSGGSGSGGSSGYTSGTGGGVGVSTKGTLLSSGTLYNGNIGGNGLGIAEVGGIYYGCSGGGGGAGTAGLSSIQSRYTTRDSWIAAGRPSSGGDGIPINITGTNYYWGAGGGGGGTQTHTGDGGLGGGGGGGSYNGIAGLGGTGGINAAGAVVIVGGIHTGGNGAPNTGSGGGGGGSAGNGGNGGSGIIIIRYLSNVGIGTTNPTSKLHLYDDTVSNTKLTIQNINLTSASFPALISVSGATPGTIAGTFDRFISFPYTGTPATNANTTYTFTTTEILNIDILIIGGGGAGGDSMGAGGGAGGVVYAINQTLPIGTYTVKVGRGGIGDSTVEEQGAVGVNQDGVESSLMNSDGTSYISFSLGGTSRELRGIGGGGGGAYFALTSVNGRNGGSGGGCSETNGPNNEHFAVNTAGSSTQPATYWNGSAYVVGGKDGRQNTTDARDLQAGGGGGLGGQSTDYRNGNDGVAISITGTSQFYAAGGGAGQYIGVSTSAGLGGSSIGGNGRIWTGSAYADAPRDVATSGTDGTGSGGGGTAYSQAPVSVAGSGGSGIVIIRYRKIVISSSIELIRGNTNDSNADYKIGNYGGEFKVISSTSSVDTDYIRITSDGASIYNPTGSPQWSTTSDSRIKENIEKASYEKCYNNINKLDLYRFSYINNFNNINKDQKQLGYIAQEVQEIFPKAVSSNPFNNKDISIPDLLTIDISQINYSLYGTVKKLIEMYNEIDIRINDLEKKLNIDTPISNVIMDTTTSNVIMDTTTSNVIMDTASI